MIEFFPSAPWDEYGVVPVGARFPGWCKKRMRHRCGFSWLTSFVRCFLSTFLNSGTESSAPERMKTSDSHHPNTAATLYKKEIAEDQSHCVQGWWRWYCHRTRSRHRVRVRYEFFTHTPGWLPVLRQADLGGGER